MALASLILGSAAFAAWPGVLLVEASDPAANWFSAALQIFLVAWFLLSPLLALAGIGCGVVALVSIRRGQTAGKGLALTGIVLGGTIALISLVVITVLIYWRTTGPEKAVVSPLREYARAQVASMKGSPVSDKAPNGEYASDYRRFVPPLWALSEGKLAYYRLKECQTIGGQSVNWKKDFALCAAPIKYGWGTRRTFIIMTDGVVWAKDLGRSEFVADFPADPAKEGWTRAE
jgi:hypothetical protein